jgi:serine/threonine-protein kinase 24/25/MST4
VLDLSHLLYIILTPILFFPQLFPRVSTADARLALTNLRAAFIEAEKKIPGVTDEIVNEVVDSVEHVEDL